LSDDDDDLIYKGKNLQKVLDIPSKANGYKTSPAANEHPSFGF